MKTSVSNQTGFDVFYGSIKGREKVEKNKLSTFSLSTKNSFETSLFTQRKPKYLVNRTTKAVQKSFKSSFLIKFIA